MRAFVVSLTLILFSFTGTSVEAQQLQGKVYCPFQGNRMIVTIVTLIHPNYKTITSVDPLHAAANRAEPRCPCRVDAGRRRDKPRPAPTVRGKSILVATGRYAPGNSRHQLTAFRPIEISSKGIS